MLLLDVRRALQTGRLSLRLNNSVVGLIVALLFVSALAAATVAVNSSNYDGPGALYVAITPYVMLFPCMWIVVTQRIDKPRLIALLHTTVHVVLAADIVVSLLQIVYLTFIDPSGYIFIENQRLNSVAQFSDIRLVGLFASGLDHGFFLTISALFSWILMAEKKISKFRFVATLIVISILVYFTYTRTAYLVYMVALSFIIGSYCIRRFGMVGIVAIIVMLGLFGGILFEAADAEKAVSGLVNSKSLLNLQTLESRYGSWSYYRDLLDGSPETILTGNALLQSAFPFVKSPPPLIDNLYLSLVLYGGVLFLVLYSLFMSNFALVFLSAYRRLRTSEFDTRLYLSLSISVVIVAIVGCSATVWDLLSIGLPATVLWALGWSYIRESRRLQALGL
ncbi:hypothetical protein [Paraburkholderia antibiotica]|uniref:Uncharacterized protein n=1 Tax=Paraburkholderia antibiotica TaxID=2728839 RepID=A0A7X9X6R6_9BURK|nr:hypothetical protein [Paraburkholderia antibiotica]NML32430.1 hypothetical protein [Paraburkholderia antibiotica]